MTIHPYEGFDSFRFNSSTRLDAIACCGEPATTRKNRNNVTELHYKDFILRFNPANDKLCECTLLPYTKATISGIKVTWDNPFLKQLCKIDGTPKDAYGFIVFPTLGIAVTGIHDNDEAQLAITLFDKSALDEFLRGSSPFIISQ